MLYSFFWAVDSTSKVQQESWDLLKWLNTAHTSYSAYDFGTTPIRHRTVTRSGSTLDVDDPRAFLAYHYPKASSADPPDQDATRVVVGDVGAADLREAVFDGANLRRVVFSDGDLTGASFKNANFAEADLRWTTYRIEDIESDLDGACLR